MNHGFELETKAARVKFKFKNLFLQNSEGIKTELKCDPKISNIGPFYESEQRFLSAIKESLDHQEFQIVGDFYAQELCHIQQHPFLPWILIKIDHYDNGQGCVCMIPEIVTGPMPADFYCSPEVSHLFSEIRDIQKLLMSVSISRKNISVRDFCSKFNARRMGHRYPRLLHVSNEFKIFGFNHKNNQKIGAQLEAFFSPHNLDSGVGIYPQMTLATPFKFWNPHFEFGSIDPFWEIYGFDFSKPHVRLEYELLKQSLHINPQILQLFDAPNFKCFKLSVKDDFLSILCIIRFTLAVIARAPDFTGTSKNLFHLFPKTNIIEILVDSVWSAGMSKSDLNLFLLEFFSCPQAWTRVFLPSKKMLISKQRLDRFLEGPNLLTTGLESLCPLEVCDVVNALFLYIFKIISQDQIYKSRSQKVLKCIKDISLNTPKLKRYFDLVLCLFPYSRVSFNSEVAPGQPKFEVRALRNVQSVESLEILMLQMSSAAARFDGHKSEPERYAVPNRIRALRKFESKIPPVFKNIKNYFDLCTKDYHKLLKESLIERFKGAHEYFMSLMLEILNDAIDYDDIHEEVKLILSHITRQGLFRFCDVWNCITKSKIEFKNQESIKYIIEFFCNDFENIVIQILSESGEYSKNFDVVTAH